jgi:uncharacterized membrane protein
LFPSLDFDFPFDGNTSVNNTILFELWDEDATFKFDNDDLVGIKIIMMIMKLLLLFYFVVFIISFFFFKDNNKDIFY